MMAASKPTFLFKEQYPYPGSNWAPFAYQTNALPNELYGYTMTKMRFSLIHGGSHQERPGSHNPSPFNWVRLNSATSSCAPDESRTRKR